MAKLDSYIARKSEALTARREDWTANPEKAVATIRASSKVAGITGIRPTKMGDYTIVSDSAPGLAGFSLGPTSPEMLLGALASCLVHTYLIHATLLNIPIDDVAIEISGTLDYKPVVGLPSENRPAFSDIQYNATVESPADAATIEQLHASVEANCPVLNTIRYPTSIQRSS
ncbi:MAG: OsmC family protein [Chloroflexi bacterium]|nr:OsmC family protein [Chloroflexota bacterium]MCC6891859.1 OsmC family protein [Anaerolineae bacterium]